MNRSIATMPRKGQSDESKKQLIIEARDKEVITTNTYQSQREAIKKYEGKIQQLTVRLPKGTKTYIDSDGKEKVYSSSDVLNKYIQASKEFSSVNTMIKALIEEKIGKTLEEAILELEESLD